MFGGGNNSTWGQQNNQNNQQQQQQQQQPQQGAGLFGGGGGFGQANTGFGQPQNSFGQPAQQNQGGGLFGTGSAGSSTVAPTFGGGGFGANNTQQNNSFGARPAFGAAGATFGTPNAGGGLFGSTPATNTFGASGNTPTNSTLFGKPATANTNTFGASPTSNLFGSRPASGGFGTTNNVSPNTVHQWTAGPHAPPPTTGSSSPQYFPTWQQDSGAQAGSTNAGPHLFHSISAMEPYKGASWEELRVMDYQQGRKDAGSAGVTSGFGQSTGAGFGQAPQSTNTFGQPPQQTSMFGAKPAGGGLFGSTATPTSGFGQAPPTNTGTGLFGQSQQNNTFGASTTPNAGGMFGQTQPAQTTAGTGLFGNTNPFGSTPQQNQQPQSASSTFSFGSTANKPTFGATGTGFGTTTGTNTFGQPANTGSSSFTFGQNNTPQQQQQQPQSGGGLFGGGGFGTNNATQNAGGGLFGQNNQQQQQIQPAGGGLFGTAAPKPGGLFGSTGSATNTGGGFTFGQPPAQPAAGGGLFGNTTNTAVGTSSLFGQPQLNQQTQAQPPAGTGLFGGNTSGGLFGAKPATTGSTGGGLFGSAQPAQQPAQTGMFGSTANNSTGGGLFGSSNNTLGQQGQQQNQTATSSGLFGGGLFGQQKPAQPQQPGAGGSSGSLFGNLGQSQPASTSLFGNSLSQQPNQQSTFGGGLFGSTLGQSTNAPTQQIHPTLTASIDQNPYGRNELFAYSGQKLDLGTSTKKPALPPLTASSFRITPTRSQLGRLRGFASPLNTSQSPPRASSPLNSLSSPGRSSYLNSSIATDRYKGLSDTALTPNAFVPRPSIKKLSVTSKPTGSMSEDKLESVLGKSALRTSTGTVQGSPSRQLDAPASSPATLVFNPSVNGNERAGEGTNSPLRRTGTSFDSSSQISGSERQPKKGEYWCRPKLEKLKQMGERDLREMHNFSAGRRGFGEVTFQEPVDLTNLSLDDLLGKVIVFGEMDISVYPSDYRNKPERGKGLNVPAKVSLENVWSRDKQTKQILTDKSDPRYQKFLKRIKMVPHTEFLGYSEDGVWMFRVEHFSRYGIDDDSEEESDNSASAKAAPPAERDKALSRSPSRTSENDEDDLLPPTKSRYDDGQSDETHDSGVEDDEDMTESEHTSMTSKTDSVADASEDSSVMVQDWEQPLKRKMGLEGMRKLREMQASFFGNQVRPVDEAEAYKHATKLKAKRILQESGGSGAFFVEAEEEDEKLDERAAKRTSFGANPPSPPKLRQPRKYVKVEYAQCLTKGDEGLRVDAGLSLGRSFRCSWGPNGELVHSGKICSPSAPFTPPSGANLYIEEVPLLADVKADSAKAEKLLDLHLETSHIELVNSVPTAIVNQGIRFKDFAHLFDNGDRSHEASIWRLGVALFDEIEVSLLANSSDELGSRIAAIRRKLALSKWLEDAVGPSVDHELLTTIESQPAKLFTLLSGNQVERAVQAAIDGKDLRLATLISQIGGPDIFKEEVLRQLEDWQRYKVNPLIPVPYRRLYALLAGITDISPGDSERGSDNCPDVIVADRLDWKRAYGLRLWFGNPFEDTVSDVFATFTAALAGNHPPATPLPPYLEKPSVLTTTWAMPSQPTDILFGMIHLFADTTISLDQILHSRDCSPSPLDYRIPWHLYMLLSRALAKRDVNDRDQMTGLSATADQLTSSYAQQLEGSGSWKWAAFVLMHLETADGREHALKALLHRHPQPSEEDVHFLISKLKLPSAWIHETGAAQLASAGDFFAQYHALIRAGLYDRAHRVLITSLVPEAVVRGDLILLRRLCEPLEDKGVTNWAFGAKLLLDYVALQQDATRLLGSVVRAGTHPDLTEASQLTSLVQALPRVLQLLPSLFPDQNDVQQVASLSGMLSAMHLLAGHLSAAGYIARPTVSPLLVDRDRLQLLQSRALGDFDRSLAALPVSA